MVCLRKQFKAHDDRAREQLEDVYNFRNRKAAIVINDANYWTFGELEKDVPERYYGDDPGVSFDYQIRKIQRHYDTIHDDCYIGFLRPWLGTGVLASAFGTEIIFPYKADPIANLSRIKTIEEALRLEMPDPGKSGIMPRVTEQIRYYRQQSDLTVAITDCQGPLATTLSVLGYDNFCYWVHDYPGKMHEFMEKITEALIQWVRFQKRLSKIPMNGEAYPLGIRIPEGFGGAEMSDDDAVMIGPDIYREFVVPCNSRFLQAFGGGCIHYCGTATQHIDNYLATKGLTALNNFNLDNLGEAAKMKKALSRKGIVYMACDFTPNDQRIESYYADLFELMQDQAGLIVAAFIAPSIALERGKYKECERDQSALAQRVYRTITENLGP